MCDIFRQTKSATIRKNITKNHNFHMILTVGICVFFTLFTGFKKKEAEKVRYKNHVPAVKKNDHDCFFHHMQMIFYLTFSENF